MIEDGTRPSNKKQIAPVRCLTIRSIAASGHLLSAIRWPGHCRTKSLLVPLLNRAIRDLSGVAHQDVELAPCLPAGLASSAWSSMSPVSLLIASGDSSDGEQLSEYSDAAISMVQEVFGFGLYRCEGDFEHAPSTNLSSVWAVTSSMSEYDAGSPNLPRYRHRLPFDNCPLASIIVRPPRSYAISS